MEENVLLNILLVSSSNDSNFTAFDMTEKSPIVLLSEVLCTDKVRLIHRLCAVALNIAG